MYRVCVMENLHVSIPNQGEWLTINSRQRRSRCRNRPSSRRPQPNNDLPLRSQPFWHGTIHIRAQDRPQCQHNTCHSRPQFPFEHDGSCKDHHLLRNSPRPFDQQCRNRMYCSCPDRGRLRNAVWHQPRRPCAVHAALTPADAQDGSNTAAQLGAHRQRLVYRPSKCHRPPVRR